jgi:hypothetical protein
VKKEAVLPNQLCNSSSLETHLLRVAQVTDHFAAYKPIITAKAPIKLKSINKRKYYLL